MNNNTEPALILKNVCLSIPVYGCENKRIKKRLVTALAGGNISGKGGTRNVEALRDINCTINKGDRVALIGHNGAGKSSFLRLISGIYKESSGILEKRCEVFPMIHKGFLTGPDLSGYEACKAHYLLNRGSLQGFDVFIKDVYEFCDLGDFLYMPMKGYSDGMSARLLFTLLTSGKHECLALDEGFGAGDASFYKKAEVRLKEFMYDSGTLILASHSAELLMQFCCRGIVFEKGRIAFDGNLLDALTFYRGS